MKSPKLPGVIYIITVIAEVTETRLSRFRQLQKFRTCIRARVRKKGQNRLDLPKCANNSQIFSLNGEINPKERHTL